MKKLFPKTAVTALSLLYFFVHGISLVLHNKYIYLVYEIIFLGYLLAGGAQALRTKKWNELIKQSAILHFVLTVLYAMTLFFFYNISIKSPQTLLLLYPLGHFLISALLFFPLAVQKGKKSKF